MNRTTPVVTAALAKEHGLTEEEYARILKLIGRQPSLTELGIFSAMWNEHCSYKSTRIWLKTLPTEGDCVIQGPGENAGVIDIGDGLAVVFKIESHNHPSFIEPYQGAATGVGGILRDIFTMGARPIATLNALRFGDPKLPRTRQIAAGVVAGIGGYANSFGVATLGGEVNFNPSYNGNCLVNAMAVGIAQSDQIFYSKAEGVGRPVVYFGATTGRDGIHGASMASAEFDEDSEAKRPTVQVGDPFFGKLLVEATLELMAKDCVIAIQDMGAAGLTCSAVEMGAKGNLGIELNLDQVPCRSKDMSAYEIMLSESQERMLMVLKPDREAIARQILEKCDLDFAIVGQTIKPLRFIVKQNGKVEADLPIKELGDQAPVYERPWEEPEPTVPLDLSLDSVPGNLREAILSLAGSANLCSRRWVYEQYDTLIGGKSISPPGFGAGVVGVGDGKKALSLSCDVNPVYCKADPKLGAMLAVAECYRNLCATGARPMAATNNLNFGNPEKAQIMGQIVKSIEGIGEACRFLDFPIVSGNVSLYNETNGEAIYPCPVIGGVGLIEDVRHHAKAAFTKPAQHILLIGGHGKELGQSAYLSTIMGIEAGSPPSLDLEKEQKHGEFIREIIGRGLTNSVQDISEGGLAIALVEMILSGNIGASLDCSALPEPFHVTLFAEDPSRYIVAVDQGNMQNIVQFAVKSHVPLSIIGKTMMGGLKVGGRFEIPLNELSQAYEGWWPGWMA